MCKELEAFERVRAYSPFEEENIIIENALKEKKKQDEVLRIIKKKIFKIDFKVLIASPDYVTYCFMVMNKDITQEEYDLLKEYLKVSEVNAND